MQHLGVGRELGKLPRRTVVEAHTDTYEKIAVTDRQIRGLRTMHAEHAEKKLVIRGEDAEAFESRGHGDTRLFDETPKGFDGAAENDTASSIKDGPLRGRQERTGFVEQIGGGRSRHVTGWELGQLEIARRVGNVLRQVDEHRTGPSGSREAESNVYDLGKLLDAAHEKTMLHDRKRDAENIDFLERVRPEKARRNLPRDGDERHRIHEGVGEPGDEVRRSGTRSRDTHADLARRPRIAVGREHGRLLVPHEHVFELGVVKRIVDGHDRAAGITEHDVRAFALETLDENL